MRARVDAAITTCYASDPTNAKQLLDTIVDGRRNLRSVLKRRVGVSAPLNEEADTG